MSPTRANGKICYLELPASDPGRSADFYARVFGWRMRKRGDGATAFDDTTGEVSGSLITGRAVGGAPGLLVDVMVESVAAVCEAIAAQGGVIVQAAAVDAPEITARCTDPAGNLLGLYQHPAR
jgi:predicted enzyme related to lactoylglutathione lyase